MYQRILVPIDGSPTSDLGCREAIQIAQGLKSKLHFLNVVDPRLLFAEVSSKVGPQELLDIWRAGGERLVAQAVAAAAAAGVSADSAVRCDSKMRVCDEILEEAGPDCIQGQKGVAAPVEGFQTAHRTAPPDQWIDLLARVGAQTERETMIPQVATGAAIRRWPEGGLGLRVCCEGRKSIDRPADGAGRDESRLHAWKHARGPAVDG